MTKMAAGVGKNGIGTKCPLAEVTSPRAELREWEWKGVNLTNTVFTALLVSAILLKRFVPSVSHLNLRLPQNSCE